MTKSAAANPMAGPRVSVPQAGRDGPGVDFAGLESRDQNKCRQLAESLPLVFIPGSFLNSTMYSPTAPRITTAVAEYSMISQNANENRNTEISE